MEGAAYTCGSHGKAVLKNPWLKRYLAPLPLSPDGSKQSADKWSCRESATLGGRSEVDPTRRQFKGLKGTPQPKKVNKVRTTRRATKNDAQAIEEAERGNDLPP